MPERSEIFEIKGNQTLSADERRKRTKTIYEPFRQALSDEIDRRPTTILLTIHSFTPVYFGKPREVEIGVLDGGDRRLAQTLLDAMSVSPFAVRANEPYGPQDGVAHTLEIHGLKRGLLNAMLEIRNDLIADETGQQQVAHWLAGVIETSLERI